VICPPRPLPATWVKSTPCSVATRAATGETRVPAGAGAAFAVGVGAAEAGSDFDTASTGAPLPQALTSSPASPMIASTVPTATVSSSGTRIASKVPLSTAVTSVSTLSVITSSTGSYFATVSPACFSHLPIVPSCTLSPSWGILSSMAMVAPLLLVACSSSIGGPVYRTRSRRL